jgi:hypothetical protein
MRNSILFLIVALFFGACSIQSRKYRPGYHIETLAKYDKSPSKPASIATRNSNQKQSVQKQKESNFAFETISDKRIEKEHLISFDDNSNVENDQLSANNAYKSARKTNILIKTIKKIKAIPEQQKEKLRQKIQLAKSNSNYPYDLLNGGGGIIDFFYAVIGAMLALFIMYLLIFLIIIIVFG